MVPDKDSEGTSENTQKTVVDLGEDLLDKTALLVDRTSSRSTTLVPDPNDLFKSAEILLSEGLSEEAKKILRNLLILDSQNVLAQKKLEEIHDLELSQIFKSQDPIKSNREKAAEKFDPEDILNQLDKDLELELFSDEDHFFYLTHNVEHYIKSIEENLRDSKAQDLIDLGIGFLEMGCAEIGLKLFQAAEKKQFQNNEVSLFVSVKYLQGYTLMLQRKYFEAVSVLELVIENSDILADQKIHCVYLMALLNEKMDKKNEAMDWYKQVMAIDPQYRDTKERLGRLRDRVS